MTLTALRASGVVDATVLDRVEQASGQGGSLINHLSQQLGRQTEVVWAALTEHVGRSCFPTPASVGPVNTRLLSVRDATEYLLLPRVVQFQTVRLLTPDPFTRLEDVQALAPQLVRWVPGTQVILKLDVAPPAAWRELFSLCYPQAQAQARGPEDLVALTALLPRRLQATHKPTVEERVDAMATFHRLPYIDPAVTPLKPADYTHLPLEPFLTKRLHPHHTNERGQLVVLGTARTPEELEFLQTKLHHLSEVLHQPMTLALCSTRRLTPLLSPLAPKDAPHV